MGVRDEDVGDPRPANRVHQGVHMCGVRRAGVEDGEIAAADQEGVGPLKCERAGIWGGDAPDAGRDFHRLAVTRVEITIELKRHALVCCGAERRCL